MPSTTTTTTITTRTSPFRPDCLRGKTALVTGGGSGIGFEIAKQLLAHGCAVVVLCGRREAFLRRAARSLNDANADADAKRGRCLFFVLDVRDPDRCRAAVEFATAAGESANGGVRRRRGLDVLVNAAAGNFLATAEGLRPKGFRTVLEIDALGTFHMCRAAHPHMARRDDDDDDGETSVVLNISATLQYGATWYQSHASAAKSAVDSLTRSLALEWGEDRVRVCGIAPGPIADTPGMTKLAPPGVLSDDVKDVVEEGVPLGRMGDAFDVGMAAVFLCSDGGAYVTGDTLVVDGGQWMWRPRLIEREAVREFSRTVEGKSREQAPSSVARSKL